MKKRLLFLSILTICLGPVSFVAFLWLTLPSHRITEESFEYIKKGMAEVEVVEIFGVPAGDYECSPRPQRILPSSNLFVPSVPAEEKQWKGNGLIISVWLDDSGKVIHSRMRGEPSESFLDKLRRFIRPNRPAQ